MTKLLQIYQRYLDGETTRYEAIHEISSWLQENKTDHGFIDTEQRLTIIAAKALITELVQM